MVAGYWRLFARLALVAGMGITLPWGLLRERTEVFVGLLAEAVGPTFWPLVNLVAVSLALQLRALAVLPDIGRACRIADKGMEAAGLALMWGMLGTYWAFVQALQLGGLTTDSIVSEALTSTLFGLLAGAIAGLPRLLLFLLDPGDRDAYPSSARAG